MAFDWNSTAVKKCFIKSMEIKALKFLLPQPRKCTEFNFSQCKLKFSILAILRCRLIVYTSEWQGWKILKLHKKWAHVFKFQLMCNVFQKSPKF